MLLVFAVRRTVTHDDFLLALSCHAVQLFEDEDDMMEVATDEARQPPQAQQPVKPLVTPSMVREM